MAKRINDAAHAPAIRLIRDGPNFLSTRGDGALEKRIGIFDDENQANGAAAN